MAYNSEPLLIVTCRLHATTRYVSPTTARGSRRSYREAWWLAAGNCHSIMA